MITKKCSITTVEKNIKENSRLTLKKIEKELQRIHIAVKNLSLKELNEFVARKEHEVVLPKGTLLFHGTKKQNLSKIKTEGLKNLNIDGKDGIFFSPRIETASDYGNIIIVCQADKINQSVYFDLDIYKWIRAGHVRPDRLTESLELMQVFVYNDFKL